MSPLALLRIIAVAALVLLLAPVQMLALRCGWRLAERLPVLFHRMVLAIIAVRVIEEGRPSASRPLLAVSNHVSWLDILVLGSRAPLSFVAKQEIAGWPVFGWLARLQRTLFVDRERRQRTGETASAMAARLRAGDRLVLFGEGTTGDGVRLLPFRSALLGAVGPALGAAWLQPVALTYARRDGLPLTRRGLPDVAWTGDRTLAPHVLGILRGGPIEAVVRWGAPIPAQGVDRKVLAREVEAVVRALRGPADPERSPRMPRSEDPGWQAE